ncbi:MAG: leucine-rich repeat domain-containing protein [Acholeplasmatales bacterium]|jgi:hypothetical protein|nr:leucine-rich repeat domain-containing protein [Acholeplasmatales bacterium]
MKKIFYLFTILIILSLAGISIFTSCNNKITPTITAYDTEVEYDGFTHSISASLSVHGGLEYTYIGIDNNYESYIEPSLPGDYLVNISYNSVDKDRIEDAKTTVSLKIILPYTINEEGDEISAYTGNFNDIVVPPRYRNKDINSIAPDTYNSTNIASIKFPNSVFYVNPNGFKSCVSLTKLYISQNTKLLGGVYSNNVSFEYYDNPTKIFEDAYGRVEGIKELKIPVTVTLIASRALLQIHIDTIIIPSHISLNNQELSSYIKKVVVYVKNIKSQNILEDNYFSNLSSITTIELQEGIVELGSNIFSNCPSLDTLIINSEIRWVTSDSFNDSNIRKIIYNGNFSMQSFYLPESLIEIDVTEGITEMLDFTFKNAAYVKKVILPSTLKSIGASAFEYCSSLEDINVPDGVITISYYSFSGCISLKEIFLPSSITEILDGAFNGCIALESINLPEQLKVIKNNSFGSCMSLKNIEIPNGVTVIEAAAFNNCTSLVSITLPKTLTAIYFSAFSFCNSLKDIYLYENIEYLARNMFTGCYSLLSITIATNIMPVIDDEAFKGLSIFCTIYVPSSLLESYAELFSNINFVAIP